MGDLDKAWKNIILELFPCALAFFLPGLARDVDDAKPREFLDKELAPISKGVGAVGVVDILAKVPLKSGADEWILLHVEVQGHAPDSKKRISFPERMFQYFVRIWDRHHRRVTALAILMDPDGLKVEDHFEMTAYGTRLWYNYNVYRVFEVEEAELNESDNPFAFAVLTARKRPKLKDDASRREFGLEVHRAMRKRGYTLETRGAMLRFLNYVIPMANKTEEHGMAKAIFDDMEESEMSLISELDKIYLHKVEERSRREGHQEGHQEGRREELINFLKRMRGNGLSTDQMSQLTGYELDDVIGLLKELPVNEPDPQNS